MQLQDPMHTVYVQTVHRSAYSAMVIDIFSVKT